MINTESLKTGLQSSKIADRRKAVKIITKDKITELADDLFALYLKEKEKNKSWEIQCELINALGILNYKPATKVIEAICNENLERDMITSKAAGCYLRLTRKSLNDIAPVKKLLSFGKFEVIDGVLTTIGIDKMIFSDTEIEFLISFINTIQPKRERGYSDIRLGLANACAGWKKSDLVMKFLQECLHDEYNPLNKAAANSLKGKYSDIE